MVRPKKENRKEDILEASLEVFAERGYYNTTTALIAEKAGISQPYVFRFFKTKEELFVAALDRAFERILQTFKNVESSSEQLVTKMIEAYEELSILHANEIALQVIGLSVTEESIKNSTRKGLSQIRSYVLERFQSAGIANADREVTTFLARGILCNISFFIDLPELIDGGKKLMTD
ncbi:TetR/AcrR family transcriptional regulator [Aneurinibacillus migulanus]|uniref:Transcriptional regulator n=1 Tax=Aneurinibacillus migulanus TaxID=47500 RepID=A0A0D1XXB1_ANEMI|nr:TetR/AcrR family transcriptional regulator [Aneurinibacillus migulanus]KIV56753.1 transcriptional regulator [Aneurinibacillus migulanus]KON97516.1 transcriptional regulator [Aneurinibacillus migulanus]MED0896774.1 TetR/AcrR family transcriptional regulator [Aneurinibacillus migulanus]MED1619901.1 TetR/AcrR family transcriptional regulator [Aneurinibacillus migulanus]SDK58359.1 transcriptional regulator, TetR family [Aneurinibacillus migulanus]